MAGVADRGDSWQLWWSVETEQGKPKKRVWGDRLKKAEWSKKAAENEAVKHELKAEAVTPKNCSFKEFAQNCLNNRTCSDATREKFQNLIDTFADFLLSQNYSSALNTITRTTVQEFIEYRLKNHKPTGLNPDITYLRHIFGGALDKGIIRKNPMEGIRYFPFKKIPREIPTSEERDKILSWFRSKEPFYFPWVYFMATRGWRRGEFIKMRIKDIDLAGERVYIWHTKGNEPRTAKLSQQDCIVLNEHLILLKKLKRYDPMGYLFPSRNGEPKSKDILNKKFRKACKELKITKKITNHTWRYFVVTSILDKTANVEVVKAITGHRDSQTIYDHYAQATPENVNKGLEITGIDLRLLPKGK